MTLPSQMPRVSRHAAFKSLAGRRNRSLRILLGFVLILTLVIGAWWLWPGGSPQAAEAGERLAATAAQPEPDLRLENEGPTRRPRHIEVPTPSEPRRTATPDNGTIAATVSPRERQQQAAAATPAQTPPQQPVRTEPDPVREQATEPAPRQTAAEPPATIVNRAPDRDSGVARLIASGEEALSSNRPVEARQFFNRALHHRAATEGDKRLLRQRLAALSETLIFSPTVVPGDALVETYTIKAGDSLTRIVAMHDLKVDWRAVARINRLSDPRRIRVGQTIKLVKGPFHAVVYKGAYRLDLYSDRMDADGNRFFIRSFPVGLGEYGSTPTGTFVVRPNSKLINPHWVNPRTGERFDADDPKNPIGEHWLGLDGVDDRTRTLSGYGLHGTIEPQSIGQDASMGCIRMLPDDIALVYELLGEGASRVEIVP